MVERDETGRSSAAAAAAAWVAHINNLRIVNRLAELAEQDLNLDEALHALDQTVQQIKYEIIERNRGGLKGMHGFIAEVAEVGIVNARKAVEGESQPYTWVNDNGPVDMIRDGTPIQQKFVAAGGQYSLGAVLDHLNKYPDFVKKFPESDGPGKYQIPRDHYETVKYLADLSRDEAERVLTKRGEGPSIRDWEKVQSFFKQSGLSVDSLEPSVLDYRQVQTAAIRETIDAEEQSIRATDKKRRDDVKARTRPGLKEGAKATLGAAAIEGGATLVTAVLAKRRTGVPLLNFTVEDWREVTEKAGLAVFKGGVRGVSIYLLSNTVKLPEAVAGAVVTVGIGVAEQTHRLRTGKIDSVEFIDNCEALCLEAAISALAAVVGQKMIPVPILGAVIGNTVGVIMQRVAKEALNGPEQELIESYQREQATVDTEFFEIISGLNTTLDNYFDLLDHAFDPDIQQALEGSVVLALSVGVSQADVLDTKQKAMDYFLL